MKKKLLSALLLFPAIIGYSQYQDHIWYFGNSTAGLSFDANNVPSGLNNKYTPFGAEGCFVATNPNTGELMFYTSGNTIINKNHVPMQNGVLTFPAPAPVPQPANGPFNSSVNGSQSVAVIEKPNSVVNNECGKFLYFINDANEWGSSGKPGSLYVGEIDMNANGGLGSVTQQPVRIFSNEFTESMIVVARPDNQGAWIILSSVVTNNLEVYQVTATGTVDTTPVSSFAIPGVNWAATWGTQNAAQSNQLIGSMIYHQGTGKFALAQSYGSIYQLYIGDFNSTTGTLSNITLRETFGNASSLYTAYSMEFSPSGNWLYNSIAANTAAAGALRAYNMLTNTDIGNLNGAGGWPGLSYIGLKAGPDGRLWVNTNNYGTDPLPARVVRSTFDIENPVALGFVSFPLAVNTYSYRFPDFLSLIPPPIATDDQEVIINCTDTTVTTTVLVNDTNASGGNLFVSNIVDTPLHGTAILTGNQISYTLNDISFVGTDTVSYLIRSDVSCMAPGKISKLLVHVNQCPRDFGDAPESYQTSVAANGPGHNVGSNVYLGAVAPDVDTNGLFSADALGDNGDGSNDEDGVSSFPAIQGGTTTSVTNYSVTVAVNNTSGLPASLCAWIDWDGNGQFDTSESVATIIPDGGTSATLTWPSATLSGANGSTGTYARFRISTDTVRNLVPYGAVEDGEVEDYLIPFTTPLPLILTSFEATQAGNTALLTWETASEQNSDHFVVERSKENKKWNEIGRVKASGNTNRTTNYNYKDGLPFDGNNYYRLRMVDKDGSAKLSQVRMLVFKGTTNNLQIVPNPTRNEASIVFNSAPQGNIAVKIVNQYGQVVLVRQVANAGRIYKLDLAGLAQGMYVVIIQGEGLSEQIKLTIR